MMQDFRASVRPCKSEQTTDNLPPHTRRLYIGAGGNSSNRMSSIWCRSALDWIQAAMLLCKETENLQAPAPASDVHSLMVLVIPGLERPILVRRIPRYLHSEIPHLSDFPPLKSKEMNDGNRRLRFVPLEPRMHRHEISITQNMFHG
jgi:hypothetical protein